MKMICDVPDEVIESIRRGIWCGSSVVEKMVASGIPLSNSEKPNKWIPVSERLPASDEDMLVTNGTEMYVGWIDPTDKRWRVDSESKYFMDDIVAWMPLPEPYKAESEDKE